MGLSPAFADDDAVLCGVVKANLIQNEGCRRSFREFKPIHTIARRSFLSFSFSIRSFRFFISLLEAETTLSRCKCCFLHSSRPFGSVSQPDWKPQKLSDTFLSETREWSPFKEMDPAFIFKPILCPFWPETRNSDRELLILKTSFPRGLAALRDLKTSIGWSSQS